MNKFAADLNYVATLLWRQIPLSVRLAHIFGQLEREATRREFVALGIKFAANANELNKMFWSVVKKLKLENQVPKDFNWGKVAEPIIRSGYNKYKSFAMEEDDIVMFVMEKLLYQPGRAKGSEGMRWEKSLEGARAAGYTDERFWRVKIKNWVEDYAYQVKFQGISGAPRTQSPVKEIEKKPGGDAPGFDFAQLKEPSDLQGKLEARSLFKAIHDKLHDPVNKRLWQFVVDNNITDVLKPTGGTGKLLQQALTDALGKEIGAARTSQIMKSKFIPDLLRAAEQVGEQLALPKLDEKVKDLVSMRVDMIRGLRKIADAV